MQKEHEARELIMQQELIDRETRMKEEAAQRAMSESELRQQCSKLQHEADVRTKKLKKVQGVGGAGMKSLRLLLA